MEPKINCNLCPRLADLRDKNKILYPNFYNDRVLGIGPLSSKLLIVGLAPGLRGANRTGKIFNGDFSGNLLFKFLKKYNISEKFNNKYGMWLIGYDGQIKSYSSDITLLKEIYNIVDKMPLREKEIIEQKIKCD